MTAQPKPPSNTVSKSINGFHSKYTARQNLCTYQPVFMILFACIATTSISAFSTSINKQSQFGIITIPPLKTNHYFLSPQPHEIHPYLSVHTLLRLKASPGEEKVRKKSNSNEDDEEWNALLSAFKMYKAAYGDLKVPSRFVVPSMPPWPGK